MQNAEDVTEADTDRETKEETAGKILFSEVNNWMFKWMVIIMVHLNE